jgi:hypothetical protein
MKKLSAVVLAVLAVTFTSCKKNYTCQCTFTTNGSVYATTSDIIHDTKSKAKTECEDLSEANTNGVSVACAIK